MSGNGTVNFIYASVVQRNPWPETHLGPWWWWKKKESKGARRVSGPGGADGGGANGGGALSYV